MCVICLLCLIVLPLPQGNNPFAVKINNNNKRGYLHADKIECDASSSNNSNNADDDDNSNNWIHNSFW
jgi:hypothetical protein